MQLVREKGATKQHDTPLLIKKCIGRHIAVHFQIHYEFPRYIHWPFLVELKNVLQAYLQLLKGHFHLAIFARLEWQGQKLYPLKTGDWTMSAYRFNAITHF